MTDPRQPHPDIVQPAPIQEDSVVPADWPSDTPPEAQAPQPTQRGPSGDEVDDPGETSEAGQ